MLLYQQAQATSILNTVERAGLLCSSAFDIPSASLQKVKRGLQNKYAGNPDLWLGEIRSWLVCKTAGSVNSELWSRADRSGNSILGRAGGDGAHNNNSAQLHNTFQTDCWAHNSPRESPKFEKQRLCLQILQHRWQKNPQKHQINRAQLHIRVDTHIWWETSSTYWFPHLSNRAYFQLPIYLSLLLLFIYFSKSCSCNTKLKWRDNLGWGRT